MTPAICKYRMMAMLDNATDSDLMMSKKHCHAYNLSSIVLNKRHDGSLLRCFLAWPGHKLADNLYPSRKLTVGIHSHIYNITLIPVAGRVSNEVYEPCSPRFGHTFKEYRFTSGVESKRFQIKEVGKENLKISNIIWLEEEPVALKFYEFHTVGVIGPAAWIVEEGPKATTTSTLFTNQPITNNEKFYRNFKSADHVRKHVEYFFNQAMNV